MSIIASAPVPAAHRLSDADTVDLMAVRRPRSAAFLTELGRRVDHLFAAGRGDQLAEHARALGSTEPEALAARDAYRQSLTADLAQRARALFENPALCPAWCTADHTEDRAERLHSRDMGEMIAPSGVDMREQKFIGVDLEAFESPELPDGIDPATIHFTMGDQGGNQIESSAFLSPELAEQLAARLFEAARLARQARR